MPFTFRNLKEDLEDLGSRFDGAPDLEFRLATEALELEKSGLSDVGGEREEGALPRSRHQPPGRIRDREEIENMQWTEVMQSDDAQLALKTFLAVDPDSRRDWFESENLKNYPAYSGH